MNFRYTTSMIMVGIVAVALGLAALRHPSQLSVSALYTVTWLALLSTLIASRVTSEPEKSYWIGFAVFGISHQILAYAHLLGTNFAPKIFTILIIDSLSWLFQYGVDAWIEQGKRICGPDVHYGEGYQIVPSLMSLFAGLCGGFISRWVFLCRKPPNNTV